MQYIEHLLTTAWLQMSHRAAIAPLLPEPVNHAPNFG